MKVDKVLYLACTSGDLSAYLEGEIARRNEVVEASSFIAILIFHAFYIHL